MISLNEIADVLEERVYCECDEPTADADAHMNGMVDIVMRDGKRIISAPSVTLKLICFNCGNRLEVEIDEVEQLDALIARWGGID